MSNILILPDMHYPFQHPDTTDIVRDAIKYYDIDEVLCTGDLLDGYYASLYKKSPHSQSASQELKASIKNLKSLYRVLGDLPVKIAIGNHDIRHMKRAFEANLPAELFLELKALIEAPAHWKFADKFRLPGNIIMEHGEGYSGQSAPMNLIKNLRANAIIGHLHSQFSITYHNNGDKCLWAMICGCLIDIDSYAFEYGRAFKDKPICGFGIISDRTPILIPV